MRILAVRGKNLASLERFEVEFESGPLEHAGIFAITGPTGAGKTTLLDALCVALFDRTPRLTNKAGVPVGTADQDDGMRVRANDVRGILRRGAAEGFAEVEFIGRDGRHYAAKWSVHRSRRRATGKLQASEVFLTDVETEQVTAGKKTETLAAIESKLGLSFEQFRRSALLAENDFAAFLRADEKQRSDLLERMTGTDIYTKVSVAAHERAKREVRELEALQGTADAQAILDDEVRAGLVTKRDELRLAHKEASAREKLAAAHVTWFADMRKADAAIEDARNVHVASQERVLAQADVVERIRRVREARDKRSIVEADEGAQKRLHLAKNANTTAEATRDAAVRAVDEQTKRVAEAKEAVATARKQYIADLESELARIDGERETLTGWLEAHKEFASAGGEVQEFFEMAVGALDLIQPSLEDDSRALETSAKNAQMVAAEAQKHRRAANKERDTLVAQLEEGELARLRDADALLVQQAAGLVSLVALEKALARLVAEREHAERELRAAKARAEALAKTATSLASKEGESARLLAEAQAAYDRIRLALDLTEHRAALAEGEHCPLCGSCEHPWRENDATASVVAEQEQRTSELRAEAMKLRERLAQTNSEREAAVQVQTKAAEDIARHTSEFESAEGEAQALVRSQALAPLGLALDAESLATAQTRIARSHAKTREALLVAESLETKAKQATEVAGKASAAWEDASEAATRALRAHEESVKKLSACRGYRYRTRDAELARLTSARAVCEEKRAAAATWVPKAAQHAFEASEAAMQQASHARVAAESDVKTAAASVEAAREAQTQAAEHLQSLLALLGCEKEELLERLAVSDAWISASQEAVDLANRARGEAAGRLRESEVRRVELAAAEPAGGANEEQAVAAHREAQAALETIVEEGVAIRAQLLADEEARKRRDALGDTIAKAAERVRVFRTLSELIGSADGKKFRVFAQSLTLDSLLGGANAHLKELAPRYLLQRVPGHDLDLQVVDRDLADEVRSVNSLSGGESFLISLALALGLSSLSSKDVRVESLLIDEGFGSLDGDTLEVALSVLDSLQATGRKVGLISHVPGFAERIGAQVIVTPKGGGRSSVHVQGPMSYR